MFFFIVDFILHLDISLKLMSIILNICQIYVKVKHIFNKTKQANIFSRVILIVCSATDKFNQII